MCVWPVESLYGGFLDTIRRGYPKRGPDRVVEDKDVNLHNYTESQKYMAIHKNHIRGLIRTHLQMVGLHTGELEELLMGTCAQESDLGTYLKQLGGGPALGIFQMEPPTYNDIMQIVMPVLPLKVRQQLRNHYGIDTFRTPPPERMVYDLGFAAIMAALQYWRYRNIRKIPDSHDIVGQAHYWKDYYNTSRGRGTVQEYIKNYYKYVK